MNEVTKETIREAIKEGKVILDFYKDGCTPCEQLGPVIERMSEERKDIKFIKANTAESGELVAQYGIMSLPTLIFIKDGEEVDRIPGFPSEEEVVEKINSF